MRTNQFKLEALLRYLELDIEIVTNLLGAEKFYDTGDDVNSWHWLFLWCEAKDERAEMWEWFQDEYPDAIMLKEGYYETR